jgi:hypothetical protein
MSLVTEQSSGGPLFQAVVLNRIEMARLLLERGADPNARVFTAGSRADQAYGGGNSEMIALVERCGAATATRHGGNPDVAVPGGRAAANRE